MNKNVVFSLLDTSAFGGAEQYMFSHLRFLSHKGYDIVLATNNAKVKEIMLSRLSDKEQKNFLIIRAPYRLDAIGNWKGLIKFFLALPRAYIWAYVTISKLSQKYDNVICLWPGYSDRSTFSPIAHKFRLPLIWIEFGTLEPIYKRNWGFPKLLFKIPSKFVKHVITTSKYTKKSIIKNSRFGKHDVTLVYPGTKLFSLRELDGYTKKSLQWKRKTGLANKNILTVVARLAHENEIDIVVKGFSEFLKSANAKNSILQIIGDGPQREELQTLVIDLHIQDNVIFHGFVTEGEKRILVKASTLFIFPRAWELDGFGMTTIEAMSLGIPVLTTNFGPQVEIVTDGKEGFRYRPHSSQDLTKHLLLFTKMPLRKRQSMGMLGVERVRIFSEELSHQKMLEVIQKYGNR